MNLNKINNFIYDRFLWIKNAFNFLNLIFIIMRNDINSFNDKELDILQKKIINNGPISLKFMQWLYKPGLVRKALWPIVKMSMLRKKVLQDGRIVHRMPFRRALKRDVWERSERAEEIRDQWKSKHNRGGNISFKDSET